MDHCTLWPDRIGSLDWSGCCAWHDMAYEYELPRIMSDLIFARCVWQVSPPFAVIMCAAVMAFGWLFYRRRQVRT